MENAINNFISLYLSPNNIMLLFVVLLIIMAIAIVLIIYSEFKRDKKDNNSFSIEEAKKELESNTELRVKKDYEGIEEYENEQEKKAIISYEELLENASKLEIDYSDEEDIPDLTIHKVNLKTNEDKEFIKKSETKVNSFYSYEAEEEFLKKLKEFRANL